MLASVLVNELLHRINETGDYPVILNAEDGWTVGDLGIGEDDNGDSVIVVYDVAH